MAETATTAGELLTLDQAFAELAGSTEGIGAVQQQDPKEAQLEIVKRILSAETAEQVLGGLGSATAARDVLGVNLELRGVRFLRSSFENENGIGVFAVLDCVDNTTGEVLAVTCGSANVMAQAGKLAQLGALPADVKILESERPTEAGYRPMRLEAA